MAVHCQVEQFTLAGSKIFFRPLYRFTKIKGLRIIPYINHLLSRFIVFLEYGSVLIFLLYHSAVLTSVGSNLREHALAIRVFGYQSHTQSEIDSFLNFLYKISLQAQIFTIPVKPRYLWGLLIMTVQALIIVVQTDLIENTNIWL